MTRTLPAPWPAACALALLAHGPAEAIRNLGEVPPPRGAAAVAPQLPEPPTASGVITGVRTDDPRGMRVEIGGRWWLVLNGRTGVLRNGRLVDAAALAVGQAVRYQLATAVPGETALGVVHVP